MLGIHGIKLGDDKSNIKSRFQKVFQNLYSKDKDIQVLGMAPTPSKELLTKQREDLSEDKVFDLPKTEHKSIKPFQKMATMKDRFDTKETEATQADSVQALAFTPRFANRRVTFQTAEIRDSSRQAKTDRSEKDELRRQTTYASMMFRKMSAANFKFEEEASSKEKQAKRVEPESEKQVDTQPETTRSKDKGFKIQQNFYLLGDRIFETPSKSRTIRK